MAAIGIDAGAGLELGRVDISGDESKFMHEYFYGYREKGWMSATAPVYGVVGISGAIAVSISNYNGTTVQAVSFGLSVGLGLPFILGGGWNQGVISK